MPEKHGQKKPSWLASAFTLARVEPKSRPSLPVLLSVVYVAWLVMTPYTNFPILTTIRFERLLVVGLWLAIIGTRRLSNPFDRFGFTFLVLIGVMYMSNLLTPYPEFSAVRQWEEAYWKTALLYFALRLSIKDQNDLKWFVAGSSFVMLVYQAYSLLDFLSGGSYVWQQGLRRAIGTWASRTVGAANAFGFLGVFSLAFSIHWLKTAAPGRTRVLAIAAIAISLSSVALSGTRGAMLVSVGLLIFAYRQLFFRPVVLSTIIGILILGFMMLPQDLQERYLSVVPGFEDTVSTNRIAERSAQSRIEGLKDGLALFANRPALGYGPGASAVARLEVSSFVIEPLQLHSLYGQVLAELGLAGAIPFALLLLFAAISARSRIRLSYDNKLEEESASHRRLVGYLFLALFCYGAVSHNLYGFYWIIALALASTTSVIFKEAYGTGHSRRPRRHISAGTTAYE